MSVPSQSEDAEEDEASGSINHEEVMFDLGDVDPMESLNFVARPWLRQQQHTRGGQDSEDYDEGNDEDRERGDRIDALPGMSSELSSHYISLSLDLRDPYSLRKM